VEKTLQQAQHTFEQLLQKFSGQTESTNLLRELEQNLKSVFSFSDFIQKVALQYPKSFIKVIERIEQTRVIHQKNNTLLDINYYDNAKQDLQAQLHALESRATTVQTLEIEAGAIIREFRHIKMLEIAWFDITHMQSIETSLLAVSHLATAHLQTIKPCSLWVWVSLVALSLTFRPTLTLFLLIRVRVKRKVKSL
jgi:glutamate-ammonia-ligase adenylyltransferase